MANEPCEEELAINSASFVTNSDPIQLEKPTSAILYKLTWFLTLGAELETITINYLNFGVVSAMSSLCGAIGCSRTVSALTIDSTTDDCLFSTSSGAMVGAICRSLKNTRSLHSLRIVRTSIGTSAAKTLCDCIAENGALSRLDIGYSVSGYGDVHKIVANLLQNPKVPRELIMVGCGIGYHSVEPLSKGLTANRFLQVLDLSDNSLKTKGTLAIVKALDGNYSLRKLRLDFNDIASEPNYHSELAAALSAIRRLTHLDLSHNPGCSPLVEALSSGLLAHDHNLVKLNLEQTGLAPPGAKALSNAIAGNPGCCLRELNLARNNIGPEGAVALSLCVKLGRTLRRLDLCGNTIGDQGAAAISDAIANGVGKLGWINLGDNAISAKGTEKIAEGMLVRRQTVATLMMWGNCIRDDGAKVLACALEKNDSLCELNVYANMIAYEGAIVLGKMLTHNRVLSKLNLWGNMIDNDGARALAQAVERRGWIGELNLGSNSFNDAVRLELRSHSGIFC